MKRATITINGSAVEFGHVWVHMQDVDDKESAPYCASVLRSSAVEVFDPHKSKHRESSWKEFLTKQINELGTFILEAYFNNMAKIAGDSASGYQWVIATLENVVESEEAIELHGQAVIFDPKRL